MSKSRKVTVIGLDGATFDLIKPWAKEGKLPTFKRLMEVGVQGSLNSTIPSVTIPAWPSFATGCNPGKHGLLDFFKQRKTAYEPRVELQPSRAIKVPTLWQILSQHSKQVGVVNVPATFPASELNGYMITGLLTPPGAEYTYPIEFKTELVDKIGNYNVFSPIKLRGSAPNMLMADLEKALEERLRVADYLISDKHVDFLMVVDNGTDRAGHEFWWCIDPSSPLFTPAKLAKYGNLLLEYYQKVDTALEMISGRLSKEAILIIMSDHGMGPVKKFVSLNTFLMQQGFVKIRESAISKIKYFFFNCGWNLNNLDKFLRKLQIQQYLSKGISDQTKSSLVESLFFSNKDIDWSGTIAYALGAPGGIRINLRGREPKGTVTQEEYELIRQDLVNMLSNATDPFDGGKIVKQVFRREELYHGPYVENAADIIAIPEEKYEFYRAYRFPFASVVQTTSGHSGSHRPNAIFIALGGEIKKGIEIHGANIIDVAPTILHIMDVPVPEEMDGRVLKELFEPGSELAKRAIKYQEVSEKERLRERIKKFKGGNV